MIKLYLIVLEKSEGKHEGDKSQYQRLPFLIQKKKKNEKTKQKKEKKGGGEKLTALDSFISADSVSKKNILNNSPFEVLIQRAKCQSKQIKTYTYSLRWVHP